MADGKKGVILVTGPPTFNRTEIAMRLAEWLECPHLLEGVILGRRLSLSDWLPEQKGAAAGIDDDDNSKLSAEQIANIALRMVCSVVPLSFLTSNIDKDVCFVLEFPVADPEALLNLLVKTSYRFLPSSRMVINRAIIIQCIPPADERSFSGSWFWSEKILSNYRRLWDYNDRYYYYPSHGDDDVPAGIITTKAYTNIYEVINQKISSLISSGKAQDPSLSLSSNISKLEMDQSADYIRLEILKQYQTNPRYIHRAFPVPIFEASRYLLFEHESSVHLRMRQWGKFKLDYYRRSGKYTGKSAMCFKGTDFHQFIKVNISEPCRPRKPAGDGDDDCLCILCGKDIAANSGDYYYSCGYCSLNLHKVCGELENISKYSFKDSPFMLDDNDLKDICKSCKEAGKATGSDDCRACSFYSVVIKCKHRPTIIHHPFFSEFIQIQVPALNQLYTELPQCAACGKESWSANTYFHISDSLCYGFSCVAHLPVEIKEHTHFGHHHPLKLMNRPHRQLDYYICHICEEERHPQHWYYYCQECEYTVHPYCIRQFDEGYH